MPWVPLNWQDLWRAPHKDNTMATSRARDKKNPSDVGGRGRGQVGQGRALDHDFLHLLMRITVNSLKCGWISLLEYETHRSVCRVRLGN